MPRSELEAEILSFGRRGRSGGSGWWAAAQHDYGCYVYPLYSLGLWVVSASMCENTAFWEKVYSQEQCPDSVTVGLQYWWAPQN